MSKPLDLKEFQRQIFKINNRFSENEKTIPDNIDNINSSGFYQRKGKNIKIGSSYNYI